MKFFNGSSTMNGFEGNLEVYVRKGIFYRDYWTTYRRNYINLDCTVSLENLFLLKEDCFIHGYSTPISHFLLSVKPLDGTETKILRLSISNTNRIATGLVPQSIQPSELLTGVSPLTLVFNRLRFNKATSTEGDKFRKKNTATHFTIMVKLILVDINGVELEVLRNESKKLKVLSATPAAYDEQETAHERERSALKGIVGKCTTFVTNVLPNSPSLAVCSVTRTNTAHKSSRINPYLSKVLADSDSNRVVFALTSHPLATNPMNIHHISPSIGTKITPKDEHLNIGIVKTLPKPKIVQSKQNVKFVELNSIKNVNPISFKKHPDSTLLIPDGNSYINEWIRETRFDSEPDRDDVNHLTYQREYQNVHRDNEKKRSFLDVCLNRAASVYPSKRSSPEITNSRVNDHIQTPVPDFNNINVQYQEVEFGSAKYVPDYLRDNFIRGQKGNEN
jgi:hypothetical protein